MASFFEIDNAIKTISKFHKKIILLYCVSGYPTPEKESNVNTLISKKNIFNF